MGISFPSNPTFEQFDGKPFAIFVANNRTGYLAKPDLLWYH
jgi:hypothetical protein